MNSFRPNVVAAAALAAVAIGVLVIRPPAADALRTALLDASRPGQQALFAIVERAETTFERWRIGDAAGRLRRLRASARHAQQQSRQWQLDAALAREELARVNEAGTPPVPPQPATPLVSIVLLEAAVLGAEHARQWQAGRFIDRGTTDGISESALVLDGGESVIDQGASSGILAGQPVYAGRCVVGRIEQVGRWMSTVQPVTHPDFRAAAQIVRLAGDSAEFGPEGLLKGTGGRRCRLTIVDPAASVSVGDGVYTGSRDGTRPFPMFFGRVARAEIDPDTHRWAIEVEPAVTALEGRTVAVLLQTLNPLRMSAQ